MKHIMWGDKSSELMSNAAKLLRTIRNHTGAFVSLDIPSQFVYICGSRDSCLRAVTMLRSTLHVRLFQMFNV